MQKNLSRVNKFLLFLINVVVVAVGALVIRTKEGRKEQENMVAPQEAKTSQIETTSITTPEIEEQLIKEEEQIGEPQESTENAITQSTNENEVPVASKSQNTTIETPVVTPAENPQPKPTPAKTKPKKSDRTTKTS